MSNKFSRVIQKTNYSNDSLYYNSIPGPGSGYLLTSIKNGFSMSGALKHRILEANQNPQSRSLLSGNKSYNGHTSET